MSTLLADRVDIQLGHDRVDVHLAHDRVDVQSVDHCGDINTVDDGLNIDGSDQRVNVDALAHKRWWRSRLLRYRSTTGGTTAATIRLRSLNPWMSAPHCRGRRGPRRRADAGVWPGGEGA